MFSIDAGGLTQTAAFAHVGTTLFNMVTNPATGELYVSNTDAHNEVRFEGPGELGQEVTFTCVPPGSGARIAAQ